MFDNVLYFLGKGIFFQCIGIDGYLFVAVRINDRYIKKDRCKSTETLQALHRLRALQYLHRLKNSGRKSPGTREYRPANALGILKEVYHYPLSVVL